jgi:hypothetical protein
MPYLPHPGPLHNHFPSPHPLCNNSTLERIQCDRVTPIARQHIPAISLCRERSRNDRCRSVIERLALDLVDIRTLCRHNVEVQAEGAKVGACC